VSDDDRERKQNGEDEAHEELISSVDDLDMGEAAARPTEVRRGGMEVVDSVPDVTAPASSAMPRPHALTRATMRLPLRLMWQHRDTRRALIYTAAALVPLIVLLWLVAAAVRVPGEARARGGGGEEIVQTAFGPAVGLRPREFVWEVNGRGELKPLDEQFITAKTWSTIAFVWEDGKPVKKGDVVLRQDTTRMDRRIADRKSDIGIRIAELEKTKQEQQKRRITAEIAVKRAELELAWQKLNERILLQGPSEETLERAERKLASLELVSKNRAEELAILEDLVGRGFATRAELQSKRLQLAESKLELEKQRYYLRNLKAGPSVLDAKEARLKVQIAEYALESDRKKKESVDSLARSAEAHAEHRLTSEKNSLAKDEEELAKYTLESPADGYILHVNAGWGGWTPGRFVWKGSRVLSIPSEGKMKVVAKVTEADASDIEVGTKCKVTIPAKPGEVFDGEVILVGKQGQDENENLDDYTKEYVGKAGRQVIEMEVKLETDDPELRPQFRAEVRFVIDTISEALVVPWGAVRRAADADSVMVVEDGALVARTVELGPSDETSVVITSGCEAGDVVLLAYGGL